MGSNWSTGVAPSSTNCNDTIIIDFDITLDILVNLEACPRTDIFVNGTLVLQTTKTIKLEASSVIFVAGTGSVSGGNGNSRITIGGAQVYKGATDSPLPGPAELYPTALPIELTSFYAQPVNQIVQLNWTTASEFNNDYFTIERSTDGQIFDAIGTVRGAGTTSTESNYTYTDNSVKPGINYYRLRQTDFNANFEYSKVIVAELPITVQTNISPNPVSYTAILSINTNTSGSLYMRLISINGQVLLENQVAVNEGFNAIPLQVGSFPAGIYTVQLNSDTGIRESARLIIE